MRSILLNTLNMKNILVFIGCLVCLASCVPEKEGNDKNLFTYTIVNKDLRNAILSFLSSVKPPDTRPTFLRVSQKYCSNDSSIYVLCYTLNWQMAMEDYNQLYFESNGRIILFSFLGTEIFNVNFFYIKDVLRRYFPVEYEKYAKDQQSNFVLYDIVAGGGEEWTLYFKHGKLTHKGIRHTQ